MFEISFYKNSAGEQPVREYIKGLKARAEKSKDARIRYEKITDYIGYLEVRGTRAGEKYTKHLDGDLWELRPLDDRILFFCWDGTEFVLLHYFKKKTQKTPKREIDIARQRMTETRSKRGEENEKK